MAAPKRRTCLTCPAKTPLELPVNIKAGCKHRTHIKHTNCPHLSDNRKKHRPRKLMARLILRSFLYLIEIPLFAQEDSTLTHNLDAFIASANAANKFNGTALIAKRGKVLLNKGYGYKNSLSNSLNDSNSVYQIGSITKSFTAVIILKLQEQGKLLVRDRLNKFFPDYPQGDKITIENLLSHTSGIYNYTNDIDDNDTTIVCYPVPRDNVLSVFKNKPLAFKPGRFFQYCNSGYFLLGMIIEKVTGMPYESVVRQFIFTPLEMNGSGFDFRNLQSNNKTQGYVMLDNQSEKTSYTVDSTVYFSAGGMYSTTSDLNKWAIAISNHLIINKNSWQQAFTPVKGNYGYGFEMKNAIYGKKYITHGGGMLGYTSHFAYFPDDELTIVLLSNIGDYSSNLPFIGLWLSAIVYDFPYSKWIATSTDFTNENIELNKYVGTYTYGPGNKIFIALQNGRLIAKEETEQAVPEKITLLSESKLYFNDFNISADFVKDENNKIIKLIIRQIGKDIECRRVAER